MKIFRTLLVVCTLLLVFGFMNSKSNVPSKNNISAMTKANDSLLRHVVLFKFKENTSKQDVRNIENSFNALPDKIKEINSYEWGLNNSAENLDKGFTHCYFITFKNQADLMEGYLPHPDHKAFVALVTPHVADVLVVDYWTK